MGRAAPACPRHSKSKVWFDGTYGTPGHRRQRYKCLPGNGDRPHRFTEPLPRQRTASGHCLECQRAYGAHEGPPTPRVFHFTTREIAAALIRVGQGESYRAAGRFVRRRARRLFVSQVGDPYPSDDGNTVADWVELFAPVIFAHHAPAEWPAQIALDALPFRVRATDRLGFPLPGGQPAFSIFAARGYGDGGGELVLLRAFPGLYPGQTQRQWEEFLRSLPGSPIGAVCDPEAEIERAISAVWRSSPGPRVFICHWHLRKRLRELLREGGVLPSDPVYEATEDALDGAANWAAFLQLVQPLRLRRVQGWLRKWRPRIDWQLTNARGFKTTVGGLEKQLDEVRRRLEDRRGTLLNRERLNRMLLLIQLDLSGLADEARYAEIIRQHLLAHGGRSQQRRMILDPPGQPSLRL